MEYMTVSGIARGSAEYRIKAGTFSWDGQGSLLRGRVLELELRGHIGSSQSWRRSHSRGRNGLSKKVESGEHNVFRRPFGRQVPLVNGESAKCWLEFKILCVGMGATERVLAFRKNGREEEDSFYQVPSQSGTRHLEDSLA